jgi:endonuclease G
MSSATGIESSNDDGIDSRQPDASELIDQIKSTIERFESRKAQIPNAEASTGPDSFSVGSGTKRRSSHEGNLNRHNAPELVHERLKRLGIAPETIDHPTRGPISFAPIESGQHKRTAGELALERILGRNDLIGVEFLESAIQAARSIGRVSVKNASGRVIGFGTGSMVSPSLFLTNNHVLESSQVAGFSTVEFGFENGTDGKLRSATSFRLDPASFFLTDKALDFTLVAVDSSDDLDRFGWLPIRDLGDASVLIDEIVNIVQHPNGQPKQLAIRDNQVTDILADFIHYRSDTQPGSSGSPVFTDQWEMVALHHSGVPRQNSKGQILARDGSVWNSRMGDAAIDWVANEGVRIERILKFVNSAKLPKRQVTLRDELRDSIRVNPPESSGIVTDLHDTDKIVSQTDISSGFGAQVMNIRTVQGNTGNLEFEIPIRISFSLGRISIPSSTDADQPDRQFPSLDEAISIDPDYGSRAGYDAKFLGAGKNAIPLPKFSEKKNKPAGEPINQPVTLHYHHFSVMFDPTRKLASCTAVNIDGNTKRNLKRDDDRWISDPRIPKEIQAGRELYDRNAFDLGHLVRRLDPAWGDEEAEARAANDDTFHFTNCSPQHEKFNRGKNLWAGLEDYLLNKAGAQRSRFTIFTGPVFRSDDPVYRSVKIPREYWKVAAYLKPGAGLVAAGFIVSQEKLMEPVIRTEISKAEAVAELFQTTVAQIERLTGLDFGNLRQADVKKRPGVAFTPGAEMFREPLEDLTEIDLG